MSHLVQAAEPRRLFSLKRPHAIATQARNASGWLGRTIAFIMALETFRHNVAAIDALGIAPTDHILDVGCGPGRALSELAARAPEGVAAGADPSELMTEIAVRRNRALVRAHRVRVVRGAAASLPFPDSSFDKVMAVHVLYFWTDLAAGFHEIARVLKPGGRLALVFRTHGEAFPSDVYRFRDLDEIVSSLDAAGFAAEMPEPLGAACGPVLLVALKR